MHRSTFNRSIRALAGAAFLLAAASPLAAQEYPTKNITLIVPFAAGGFVDAAARLLQPEMEKRLGRSVLIENRLGAGGAVGTGAVVRADPDGHTLLMVASSHAVAPAVNPNLNYDTVNDLKPIIMIARDPMLFVVSNKVPAKTLKEFVEYAKTKPGELNYSSPGFGSQTQFIAELFNLKAGIKLVHVPYRGGGPALQAVTQGEVEFSVLSGQVTLPQIGAGAIRALALGGETRDPRSPTTQTLTEAGFPEVEAIQWAGMLAPVKTPDAIVKKLNATVNEILTDKTMRERLATQGMSVQGGAPEVLGKAIETEVVLWKDIAKAANMQLGK